MVRILFFIVVLATCLVGCNERQVFGVKEGNHSLQDSKLETNQESVLISTNDKHFLEKLVQVEARQEPYVGQVAIASVVLNRMKNPNFPNDIADVISELKKSPSVLGAEINVSDTSKKAVLDAINGLDPSGGALYYFTSETSDSKLKAIKKIGNITFYK